MHSFHYMPVITGAGLLAWSVSTAVKSYAEDTVHDMSELYSYREVPPLRPQLDLWDPIHVNNSEPASRVRVLSSSSSEASPAAALLPQQPSPAVFTPSFPRSAAGGLRWPSQPNDDQRARSDGRSRSAIAATPRSAYSDPARTPLATPTMARSEDLAAYWRQRYGFE
jgi:hypothetical protein